MKALVFVSSNISKAQLTSIHLNYPIEHRDIDLDEIQSLNMRVVVEHKVRQAYALVGRPVIVEDTALIFKGLGKLPGPFIKWFLEAIGNRGLCKLLDGQSDRSAIAYINYGFFDGEQFKIFEGKLSGQIAKKPIGKRGFFKGWDPIFMPEGWDKTLAQMTKEEQISISMRKIALGKLAKFLVKNPL